MPGMTCVRQDEVSSVFGVASQTPAEVLTIVGGSVVMGGSRLAVAEREA